MHCAAGNRVGQVSAAYRLLEEGNVTLQQVYDWDTEINSGPIATPFKNGLAWYCYYLTYVEMYPNLECEKLVIPTS